jgi:hypothetical protein
VASSPATLESYARAIAVRPALTRIAPIPELVPGLPERTLLHAGPPFSDPLALPPPVFNSVVAACRLEGWADEPDAVRAALQDGSVRLAAAQDHGVVTPLAFVVGPSAVALEVRDLDAPERAMVSPLNDGPLPHALRLGTGHPEGVALVRSLIDGIGADLSANLKSPIPLLPVLAKALAAGDELHGRVEGAQAQVPGFFEGTLPDRARDYLERANQFVLNVVMAASALTMKAGAGVPESDLVVAAAGNGRDFGWKLAKAPDTWVTAPAARPIGGRLPGHEESVPLPAIGDSAVVDAIGFGAACLRFAPALGETLRAHVDPGFYDEAAHAPFVGPHPALPEGMRVGLDLTRQRRVLGIMLGMVGEAGTEGLIGRGVAPWPS